MNDQELVEELEHRVEKAVHELLAENGGGMLTSFVMWVDYMDADGQTMFAWVQPGAQRLNVTAGLVRLLDVSVTREMNRMLDDDG